MMTFVDTSAWFAVVVKRDRNHSRALDLIVAEPDLLTTDHILVECWLLIANRYRRSAADEFWRRTLESAVRIAIVDLPTLNEAWNIRQSFLDQAFSLVDCTSFATMQKLHVDRAISFDDDFSVFRYGTRREMAFEVLR